MNVDKLLSTEEVAERLGISKWTLIHWRRGGINASPDLPYIRIGKTIRYWQSDVERYLRLKTVTAEARAA